MFNIYISSNLRKRSPPVYRMCYVRFVFSNQNRFDYCWNLVNTLCTITFIYFFLEKAHSPSNTFELFFVCWLWQSKLYLIKFPLSKINFSFAYIMSLQKSKQPMTCTAGNFYSFKFKCVHVISLLTYQKTNEITMTTWPKIACLNISFKRF